jgi:hypothetical protein
LTEIDEDIERLKRLHVILIDFISLVLPSLYLH